MRTASSSGVLKTTRLTAGLPLKRRRTCSSPKPSTTRATSPTDTTCPVVVAWSGIARIASARSAAPSMRTPTLAPPVRMVPEGTSAIHACTTSATCGRRSPWRASAARSTSTRIWYGRAPVMITAPMPGSVRRSSPTRCAERLSASSPESPKSVTMITGKFGLSSVTRMRSAPSGRSWSESTAMRMSSRPCSMSAPSANSTTTAPPPSARLAETFLAPSTSMTASSILRAIDSSTSAGLAPG